MFPKCFALATLPATVLRVYPFNNARKRKWRKNKNLQTLTRPRTKTSAEKRILRIRPVSTLVDVPTLVGRASKREGASVRERGTHTHSHRQRNRHRPYSDLFILHIHFLIQFAIVYEISIVC